MNRHTHKSALLRAGLFGALLLFANSGVEGSAQARPGNSSSSRPSYRSPRSDSSPGDYQPGDDSVHRPAIPTAPSTPLSSSSSKYSSEHYVGLDAEPEFAEPEQHYRCPSLPTIGEGVHVDLAAIKDGDLDTIVDQLRRTDLQDGAISCGPPPKHVHVMMLASDSATETLAEGTIGDSLIEVDDLASPDVPEKLLAYLRDPAAKSELNILVGHIEEQDGASYIVNRSAGGRMLWRMDLAGLADLARQERVPLLILGCGAAQRGVGISGAAHDIRTLDAIERLSLAVTKNSYMEFLESLASKDFNVIIEKGFIEALPTEKRPQPDVAQVEGTFERKPRTRRYVYIGQDETGGPEEEQPGAEGAPSSAATLSKARWVLVVPVVEGSDPMYWLLLTATALGGIGTVAYLRSRRWRRRKL